MKLHLPKRLFTALLTAITLAAAPAALTLGSAAWGEEEVSTPVEAQADYSVYDVTMYGYNIVRWQGAANTSVPYSVCYAPYKLASYTDGAFVFTSDGVVSNNPYQTYVTGSDFYTFMFNADSACNDEDVAFIKSGTENGKFMWSIYAADGERIAMTDDRDFAFVVARQNDLNPQSVH